MFDQDEAFRTLVLREFLKRQAESTDLIERLRRQAHPEQLRFIEHESRWKAAICSRRAGKSFGVGLLLFMRALANPHMKHLYLALTRDSAKRIMWDDVLKTIARNLKIPCRFNETELSVRFGNGSIIYLLGADARVEEQDKILGQKYKTVVVDEAASFRTELRRIIYKTIEPATIDYDGTIILIGTPGDFIGPPDDRHLFYAATSGSRRGEASFDNEENHHPEEARPWCSFRWNTFDNTAIVDGEPMSEKWRRKLDEKIARTPHFVETVTYKTEWLGEWAIDSSKLVYRFSEDRNLIDRAPDNLAHWVIGIDLGHTDATAFHVWGWRPYDGLLYGLESHSKTAMDLDAVSLRIRELHAKYPHAKLVIDGAAKQAVEHLRKVYHHPLHAAEKQGKIDFIRHFNTDLVTGRIKLVRSACAPLIAEWSTLIWDERARVPVEKEGCDNHCADAALYGWRDSLHFTHKPQPKKPHSRWSEEAVLAWEVRQANPVDDDY